MSLRMLPVKVIQGLQRAVHHPGLGGAERGSLERLGNQRHLEGLVVHSRNGKGHAIDGVHDSAGREELGLQVLDAQQCRHASAASSGPGRRGARRR